MWGLRARAGRLAAAALTVLILAGLAAPAQSLAQAPPAEEDLGERAPILDVEVAPKLREDVERRQEQRAQEEESVRDRYSDCDWHDVQCRSGEFVLDATGANDLITSLEDEQNRDIRHIFGSLSRVASAKEQPGIASKYAVTQAVAFGLIPLLLVISALRYWTAGIIGGSVATAVMAFCRAAIAVFAIIVLPTAFNAAQHIADAVTVVFISQSGDALLRLIEIFFLQLNGQLLFVLIIAFLLFLIIFVKVMLGALLAVLFVFSPVAIALWVLDEAAWVARGTLQGSFGIMLFMPVAGCVLMVWGVFEPFDELSGASWVIAYANGFYAIGGLYLVYKLGITVVKQAGFGSATPAPSRLLAFAAFARMAGGGRGGGGGRQPEPRRDPAAPARAGTEYTRHGQTGEQLGVHARERGGRMTWERTLPGVAGGPSTSATYELTPQSPEDAARPRQDRPSNVRQIGGDKPPEAPRHAAGEATRLNERGVPVNPPQGEGRHRARPGAVERDGATYNPGITRPELDGDGNPLSAETRRFADLPRGAASSEVGGPNPPPPMSPYTAHGAGQMVDGRRAEPGSAGPDRTYYEPMTFAKERGRHGTRRPGAVRLGHRALERGVQGSRHGREVDPLRA